MISVGVLHAVLALKNELTPQMIKAAKEISPIAAKIGAAVAAGFAAAATAIVAATKAAINFADALDNQGKATQASAEALQILNLAAERAGHGPELITAAFRKMNDVLGSGTKETVATLDRIGLSFAQIRAMKPEDQFRTILDALAKIPDVNTRVAAGTDLLGKGYSNLQTIAGPALVELEARMRELGILIGNETVAAVDALGDDLELLGRTMEATVLQFGSAVAQSELLRGAVNGLIEGFGLLNNFIKENGDTIIWWANFAIGTGFEMIKAFTGAVLELLGNFDKLGAVLERAKTSPIEALISGENPFAGLGEEFAKIDRITDTSQKLISGYFEKLKKGADDAKAALGTGGGGFTGAVVLSEKALKDAAKAAEEAAKAYSLLLTAGQQQFEFTRSFNEELKNHATDWNTATDAIFAGTQATHEGRIAVAAAAAGYVDSGVKLQQLEVKTMDWGAAMDGVNDVLSEARGVMTLLGVSADSVFGKILDWVSKAFDAFNSLVGIIGKIAGAFSGSGSGWVSQLASLAGGGGGTGSTVASVASRALGIGSTAATTAAVGAGTAAAVGGAAIPVAGSFAGAGLSATVGGGAAAAGMSGGMIALAATGYGAIAVAAIIAIRAALKKASAETTAEFLGIDFEVLSKGLRKELQTMGKEIGDFSTALQLNLGQVFAEGGVKGGDAMAAKMADTFSFLDRKQIDATQAQQILNDTTAQVLPIVAQMGEQGVMQLERLFAAAQRTGVSFEGMSELAVAYVQRANELGIAVNDVVLNALGLESALATITTAPIDNVTDAANSAADALSRANAAGRGFIPGGGGGERFRAPDNFPVTGAQHGFHGTVTGPRGFMIEAGKRERVDIGPEGSGGGMRVTVQIDARSLVGIDERQAQRLGDIAAEQIANRLHLNPGGLREAIKGVRG